MPHMKLLTHEDDLFGRVALFNNMVTLDQIVECARTISAEIAAERPQRSLARVLILKGYLTTEQAGAIQAALRKKAAEQSGVSAAPPGPTPKPKPLDDRAPAGTSQVCVAITEESAAAQGKALDLEAIKKIVARIAPGRIYPEMLDYITSHHVGIIDPDQLAKAIDEPRKQVVAALGRWCKIGLLRREAGHPYCYGPRDKVAEQVEIFLSAWHEQSTHSAVLGFILECE